MEALRQAADAEHARFSPSSADRWMTCPGSIALTRDCPSTSSFYADEGTAAHTLASRALTYRKPAAFFCGETTQVGQRVFTFDEEMCNFVQLYLDEVGTRIGDGTLMVEQKIEFSQAVGVPGQFGTSDVIVLSADGKRAQIGDLKYGQGVKVYVEENRQLMTYAIGVLETFDVIMGDVEEVDLFVCQPRLDHLDSWTVSVERLRQHAAEMRLAAGAAIEGLHALEITGKVPAELFKPSDKACFFCPAKATCEALRHHVSKLVFDDFETLDDPEVLEVTGRPLRAAGPEARPAVRLPRADRRLGPGRARRGRASGVRRHGGHRTGRPAHEARGGQEGQPQVEGRAARRRAPRRPRAAR
jgi:hypothetical protein